VYARVAKRGQEREQNSGIISKAPCQRLGKERLFSVQCD
jgi:hypothetical protein